MSTLQHNSSKCLRAFGIGQIILGCCLIVLDVIAFSTFRLTALYISFRASGLWSGVLYVVSGAISVHCGGVLQLKSRSRKLVIVAVSLNALSSLCAVALSIPFAYAISNTYMFCVLDNAHCTLFSLRCAYLGFSLMTIFVSLASTIAAAICLCYKVCPRISGAAESPLRSTATAPSAPTMPKPLPLDSLHLPQT